jgi:hypothetical protein
MTRGYTFKSKAAMSTRMACADELVNKMESSWDLDGATYIVQSLRIMSGGTGPTIQIVITTKK